LKLTENGVTTLFEKPVKTLKVKESLKTIKKTN
jgi:hypothetical protein